MCRSQPTETKGENGGCEMSHGAECVATPLATPGIIGVFLGTPRALARSMENETVINGASFIVFVLLLAALLGSSATTVRAQSDEPTSCEECRTDAECERLCGGEYGYGICEGHPPRCQLPPGSTAHPAPFCLCSPSGVCGWVCPGGSR